MIIQTQFRELVNQRLKELDWPRARLAREMGVAPSYVSGYLNGKNDPGDDVKHRFCAALGVWPLLSIERTEIGPGGEETP